ncbi:MAG TPA: ribosome recycling factor [Miltoncostaeaceae bacterium]|nr:ribosome recycling factor [Miltoncostaeaceae bacterium]
MADDDRMKDAKRRMEGAVAALTSEFAAVRTGRASTGLLDRIQVDAYGTKTPLNQLATISAPEARLLTVSPFDPSITGAIERAIMESDLGLTPNNDGKIIRLPIPQLTEERRKEMVRLVHKMAEEGRVAVRNVRRDVIHDLKKAEKDGELSRDELKRAEDDVQKLTDAEVKTIDDLMGRKEAEILEV